MPGGHRVGELIRYSKERVIKQIIHNVYILNVCKKFQKFNMLF